MSRTQSVKPAGRVLRGGAGAGEPPPREWKTPTCDLGEISPAAAAPPRLLQGAGLWLTFKNESFVLLA